MKRTLVYCHPYDKSFNAAIKSVIIDVHTKNDEQLKVFDLNEMQFNPVMSQKDLQEFVRARKEGVNKVSYRNTLLFVRSVRDRIVTSKVLLYVL